jgi:hypothetical protein
MNMNLSDEQIKALSKLIEETQALHDQLCQNRSTLERAGLLGAAARQAGITVDDAQLDAVAGGLFTYLIKE